MILRVGALKAADGGDAHAIEVRAGFGGVALKIAMERAVLLGEGELVAGLGEMIHADVEVAGFEELRSPTRKISNFSMPSGRCAAKEPCCFFSQGTWA